MYIRRRCDLLFDGFDSDFSILWEEDKHLVRRIVVVSYQNGEVCSIWMPLTDERKAARVRVHHVRPTYLGRSPNWSLNWSRV